MPMDDLSYAVTTLRTAVAQAAVTAPPKDLNAIAEDAALQGEAQAAALLTAKSAHALAPSCHEVRLDHAELDWRTGPDGGLILRLTVRAVTAAPIELHALMGVGAAAAVACERLRRQGSDARIENVGIAESRGRPETYGRKYPGDVRAAVLVISDSIASGKKDDAAGQRISKELRALGVEVMAYEITADDAPLIQERLRCFADDLQCDLVLTTGGTGYSPRDNTPEAMEGVVERWIPGVSEAARAFGQARMPYAMLSRGVSGIRGRTLIVNLPGSRKGAEESLKALFPHMLHAVGILRSGKHKD